MAKIYLALLLFATVLFAAPPPRFSSDCLTQKALQRQELRQLQNEKTRALIPNSIFSRALAKGTRWGAVAAVTGAGLGMLAKDEMGLVPVFLSILGGAGGFATGFSFGVLNKKSRKALRRNPPKKYRVAFNMEVNSGMADHSPVNDPSFGIVLRWRSRQNWISKPNYLRVYYGRLIAENSTKTIPRTAYISDKRFGLEFLKIRRDKSIHFFYGLGFGYSAGTYARQARDAQFTSDHPVSSAFLDLIFGLNLNFTDFSQAQLVYKWEPLSVRNQVKASDHFNAGINHLIGFSFIVFLV